MFEPPLLAALLSGTTFSPRALFAGGEQGAWYDPSDFSTMFQDSAGSTPVTAVEQPVGLLLDKSKGLALGPELIADPSFNTPASWTVSAGSLAVTGGNAVWTSAASGVNLQPAAGLTPVSGRWYYAEVTITAISAGTLRVGNESGTALSPDFTTTGKKTFYFSAPSTSNILLRAVGTTTATVSDYSIRELSGNHASQSTAASRPVLSARVNLLTYSETLTNAVWSSLGGTIASSVAVSPPSGVTSIFKLSEDSTTGRHLVGHVSAITVPAGALTASAIVRKVDRRYVTINFVNSSGNGWFAALFDLDTGTYLDNNVASVGSTQTFVSGSVSSLGDSWYRITINGTTTATSGFVTVAHANAALYSGMTVAFGNPSFAGTTGNASYVSAIDLRVTNDGVGIPAYQRINAATDYDTSGFPLYLSADGTDDSMATSAIDFSATDKMSVFAGVRKLSDAAAGIFAEFSTNVNTNAGSFYITVPEDTGLSGNYAWKTRGSVNPAQPAKSSTLTAPRTDVLAGIGGIAADTAIFRINGAEVASLATDQGTGNYGDYPLYIGRRGGTTLPFNGRIYGLIIVGRALTSTEISSTERWLASKSGVSL